MCVTVFFFFLFVTIKLESGICTGLCGRASSSYTRLDLDHVLPETRSTGSMKSTRSTTKRSYRGRLKKDGHHSTYSGPDEPPVHVQNEQGGRASEKEKVPIMKPTFISSAAPTCYDEITKAPFVLPTTNVVGGAFPSSSPGAGNASGSLYTPTFDPTKAPFDNKVQQDSVFFSSTTMPTTIDKSYFMQEMKASVPLRMAFVSSPILMNIIQKSTFQSVVKHVLSNNGPSHEMSEIESWDVTVTNQALIVDDGRNEKLGKKKQLDNGAAAAAAAAVATAVRRHGSSPGYEEELLNRRYSIDINVTVTGLYQRTDSSRRQPLFHAHYDRYFLHLLLPFFETEGEDIAIALAETGLAYFKSVQSITIPTTKREKMKAERGGEEAIQERDERHESKPTTTKGSKTDAAEKERIIRSAMIAIIVYSITVLFIAIFYLKLRHGRRSYEVSDSEIVPNMS